MTKYEEEGRTAVRTQLELVVFIALGFISFVMVTAYFTHHVIRDFKLLAGITGDFPARPVMTRTRAPCALTSGLGRGLLVRADVSEKKPFLPFPSYY